jgi:predicted nuclease of predicted toxin-antitoxin system
LRFFVDECLSPEYAVRLGSMGYDAIHPLHVGRRGEPDHVVRDRCIAEDRVIITENMSDFRALLGGADLHPGLIGLPASTARGTGGC